MQHQADGVTISCKTILVVEDYPDTREMVRRFLEIRGYRVLEGTNGEEALAIALRERPDLILMDLKMPVLDGFTATRMLREIEDLGDVPVIAITADGERGGDFYRNVDELGIGRIECIHKPLDFGKLESIMLRLLQEI